ncbi:MAG: hypothetical protein KDC45_03975 [Bacteroidetes bacterium]|nr:hypothetical protein [Bacteroidota bacterium]
MNIRTVLLILLFCSFVYAQDAKKTIAVLDFQTSGGLSPAEVTTLANRFRGILVQTRVFDVVEREKMNDILVAQDFNMSDACNTAECAVQVGQLLGVEQMIAGDLGKIGQTYTIDLRLIDVESSKIVGTQTKDYKGEIDGLLSMMTEIARQFASQATGQQVTISQPSTPTGPGNKMLWYIVGGAAVLGGGAAALLLGGGGGGGGAAIIPDPSFPN